MGIAVLLLLAAGTTASETSLLCGSCGEPIRAELKASPGYLIFSPAFRLLDGVAFLSVRQHVAFLITLVSAFAVWRGLRYWRAPRRRLLPRLFGESVAWCSMLAGLVALYAAVVAIPRPQARLALHDPDELAVDFHSHTAYSHDGRSWFTAERNRRWHASVGFDAAYVTDHAGVQGALEATRSNPARAGEGTVLLPGVELRLGPQHIVLLGVREEDDAFFTNGAIDAAGLDALRRAHRFPVPLVLTLPAMLDSVGQEVTPDAVEGNDASPRGLEQVAQEGERLHELRDGLGVPLVAASNNHGWFNAAIAWSVLRVPGWRAMTPEELDVAIRTALTAGGPEAVRIVERTRLLPPADRITLAGTLPLLLWNAVRTLTPAERVVWLLWGMALTLVGLPRRERSSESRIGSVGSVSRPLPLPLGLASKVFRVIGELVHGIRGSLAAEEWRRPEETSGDP